MSVTGKVLYEKVRKLRPELSSSITPGLLNEICGEPNVQPFLKWFCENVTRANVLSDEELQIKKQLERTNEWLEGDDLDTALEEATRDCPELLKLVSFDDADVEDLFAQYEITKESHKEDENYIHTLKNSVENLKKLAIKLDKDIEDEKNLLELERIKAAKAYEKCSTIISKFNKGNHEFSKGVENLLNIYADAAENKGDSILWTQMPLELFIEQIKLYNEYLSVYVKKQFAHSNKEEQKSDLDYAYLINSTKEERTNDKIQELMSCKTNITNSKYREIVAKVQEAGCVAMLDYVQEIYNDGNLNVPRESELGIEILLLTRKRDILEESTALLRERRLAEVVQQFGELEIRKVLKENAQVRLEQRRVCLEKLKNLRSLAREHGHIHADLLCMLMKMQIRSLKEVVEFVADARHYLTTEYSLSSARLESMRHQQDEYNSLLSSLPKSYNSFDKLFISMLCGDDNSLELNPALEKYNELLAENKEKRQTILGTYIDHKVDKLQILENEVSSHYTNEIQLGPTYTLKPVHYDVATCHNVASENMQRVQGDLKRIRDKLKERMRTDRGFEREKELLWQRFLADPDTLRKTYDDVKQEANKSHFGNTYTNE